MVHQMEYALSITTGDVNGINENTVETVPCGSSITVKTPT